MQEHLKNLAQLLREQGEVYYVSKIEDAISGPQHELDAFLISNDLWGGAGSIADQAGMVNDKGRTEERRKIEYALIELGDEQIRVGKVNVRTAMWVDAFKKWKKNDI